MLLHVIVCKGLKGTYIYHPLPSLWTSMFIPNIVTAWTLHVECRSTDIRRGFVRRVLHTYLTNHQDETHRCQDDHSHQDILQKSCAMSDHCASNSAARTKCHSQPFRNILQSPVFLCDQSEGQADRYHCSMKGTVCAFTVWVQSLPLSMHADVATTSWPLKSVFV